MQQSQSLYISQEEYRGFLGRPTIPLGELWVFAMPNGDCVVASREDNDYFPPPPKPWMRTAILYKLRKQAVLTVPEQYFPEGAFPTTITWAITLKLREAIAFIQSGQYSGDNLAQVSTSVIATLHPHIEEILIGRLNPQVVSNPHDLTPPPVQSLLPRRDFSSLVRGTRAFNDMGVEVSAVVQDIQSPEYSRLIRDVTFRPQNAILDSQVIMIGATTDIEIGDLQFAAAQRQRLVAAQNDITIAMQQLGFDETRIRSIVGQTEIMMATNAGMIGVIQTVASQLGQTSDPQVAERLIRDMMNKYTYPAPPSIAGTMSGANPQAQPQLGANPGTDRASQIQQLYLEAGNQSWQLSPAQHLLRELLTVKLPRDREIELQIPSNYPQGKVRISKAKVQGARLPQSQVNGIMQGITANAPDLVSLVLELDNNIQ